MKNFRKKTSMQDIAEHLGVSKNAVSLALNNKPGISESLRRKIVHAAVELNYGGYGSLESSTVGGSAVICVPEAISAGSHFYSSIYWAIEQELKRHGIGSVMMSISLEMEAKLMLPEAAKSDDVVGLIFVGLFSRNYIAFVAETTANIVLVDNYFLDFPINSVITANEEGGYLAGKYLIETGHRRIGFVGPVTRQFLAYRARWLGCGTALEEAGLVFDKEHTYMGTTESGFMDSPQYLHTVASELLVNRPDAVFCVNDRLALLLMGLLSERGIHVPNDISIMGFDDTESAELVYPPLTTVRVQRAEMGRRAALLCIQQARAPELIPARIVLFPELVIRKSIKLQMYSKK